MFVEGCILQLYGEFLSTAQVMCCLCGAFKLTHLVPYLSNNRHYSKAGPKISLHVLGSEDYLASSDSLTSTKSPHWKMNMHIQLGHLPKGKLHNPLTGILYTAIYNPCAQPSEHTPRPPTSFSAANVHLHNQNISRRLHVLTRPIFWNIYFSF